VAKEVNVSGSFSFLSLFMIMSNVVVIGGRFSLAELANIFSNSIIDGIDFLVGIDIEISDGVDRFSGDFSVGGVSPVVFNTGSVPLVNDGNNLLAGSSVELIEQIEIFMVNQDLLLEGSVFFEQFDQPVESVIINDFSETFTSSNIQNTVNILVFGFPFLVV